MEKNSKYPYALPRVGYFNSLEDVEVHCFSIQDTTGNKSRRAIHH